MVVGREACSNGILQWAEFPKYHYHASRMMDGVVEAVAIRFAMALVVEASFPSCGTGMMARGSMACPCSFCLGQHSAWSNDLSWSPSPVEKFVFVAEGLNTSEREGTDNIGQEDAIVAAQCVTD